MSKAHDYIVDDLSTTVAAHLGCTLAELGLDWVAFIEAVATVITDPDPANRSTNVGRLAIAGNAVALL